MKYQELLSAASYDIYNDLKAGKLTKKGFHNKRTYSRSKRDVKTVLTLTAAWEAFNCEK